MKVDSALSAAFLVAVSVASYNCLQRRSSWAISCQEKQSIRALCILKIIGGGVAISLLYNFIPRLPVPPFLFWTKTWPGARCMRMHEKTADNNVMPHAWAGCGGEGGGGGLCLKV